jgi:hypothetical protein
LCMKAKHHPGHRGGLKPCGDRREFRPIDGGARTVRLDGPGRCRSWNVVHARNRDREN